MPQNTTLRLTPRQERAVAALLAAPTIDAAATQAEVDRTTLYRWLKLPAFRARYEEARRKATRLAEEAHAVAVQEMSRRHAEAARLMFEFAMNGLEQLTQAGPPLTVDQVGRLLLHAFKLERAAMGLPSHILEQQVTEPRSAPKQAETPREAARQVDVERLSLEEKAQLAQTLRKLLGRDQTGEDASAGAG